MGNKFGKKDFDALPKQADFNKEHFLGVWYEQLRHIKVGCGKHEQVQMNFVLNQDQTIDFTNSYLKKCKKKNDEFKGKVTFEGASYEVKLDTCCHKTIDYKVFETDYVSYAIVYSYAKVMCCEDRGGSILTRDKNPSQEILDRAVNALKGYVSDTKMEDYHRTVQWDDNLNKLDNPEKEKI